MQYLKYWIILFAALGLLPGIAAAEVCSTQGVCTLPGSTGTSGEYAVYAPVGESSIRKIRQAPRLDTFHGKTIAVVGGSFMAYVTHPEIKRLILKEYPTAKVLLLNEIGSAGPWPGPGVIRKAKDDFMDALKARKVDAVISGNGGCGLCTPKEMGSCIAAEYSQIPSVMIAAPGFSGQAKITAVTAGVPVPRIAEYPGAFSAHSKEELLKNTREILWPQIKKALLEPISEEEVNAADRKNALQGVVFRGSYDEVVHYFAEQGWSDGLPFVPPTEERIAEFLKFTDLPPDTVIGNIPPSYTKATVRLAAVNGVMSGCPAEFMPLLIAFTRAMTDGDFRRTLASTHAWTPYCWINGPVARQLGLDHGQGEISSPRNAAMGRFLNLAMRNLGGYHIKQNRMGTFGYLMPWCLTEDEAAAVKVGWKPYHMQQGYNLNDNALTAASALNWGNNLAPATSDPQKIMEIIAWDAVEKEQFAVGSGTPFVYRTLLLTEYVARDLAKGFSSKNLLEDALIRTARRPLAERAFANYWANPGSAFPAEKYPVSRHAAKLGREEGAKITAVPPWLAWIGRDSLETVPVMQKGKTAILITGDDNRNKSMFIPGGGFATVRIELPAGWDELMAAKGYAPLKEFTLQSDLKPDPPVSRNPARRRFAPGNAGGRMPYRMQQ